VYWHGGRTKKGASFALTNHQLILHIPNNPNEAKTIGLLVCALHTTYRTQVALFLIYTQSN
jgi:hypothetical protein